MNPTLKINIAVLVLCALCFGDTLNGSYVFDDSVAIVKNRDITKPTSLKEIFVHDFWGINLTSSQSHKSYRPLTSLMFRFEYQILNFRSCGMKSMNFLLHFLNSSLVLQLIKSLTRNYKVSASAAILFAIHPIHTEAVSGVVGRADLMFCICFLVALITRRLKGTQFKGKFIYLFSISLGLAPFLIGIVSRIASVQFFPCDTFKISSKT